MRHSAPGCPNYAHYWSDQAGQRLGATDSLSQLPGIREALSYTAQGQLYYAVTATDSPGDYDFNWNWYDASGLRVMAALYNQNGVTPAPQPLTLQGGTWAYYLYDGPELGLVLRRSGTTVKIQQRFVSAGVDGSLAGRFWVTGASAQSLALLTDHQGTTLAALNPNGTEAAGYVYKPLSAFGASDDPTASPSGSVAASSTGFTGASTPNATGGMVYLRNRWYDPQSGRFLTQDPIGLAGGVNLYAYAGNDPIAYTDPFGLRADSIEVRWHKFAGKNHASIRISPDDQKRWANDPRFKRGKDGRVSVTLSAAPKACLSQGVCLVSDLNRSSDTGSQDGGRAQVDLKGQDENTAIERLLRADAAYGDNLGYDPLPKLGEGRFNSNSYVSGTLRNGGVQPPPIPADVPGYDIPIP